MADKATDDRNVGGYRPMVSSYKRVGHVPLGRGERQVDPPYRLEAPQRNERSELQVRGKPLEQELLSTGRDLGYLSSPGASHYGRAKLPSFVEI